MVSEGFTGLGRLTALACAGLRDLGRHTPWEGLSRCGLQFVLSNDFHRGLLEEKGQLPSRHDARRAEYTQRLIPNLFRAMGVRAAPGEHRVLFGESGLLQALKAAVLQLETDRLDRCIVGAVDSLVEPQVVAALGQLGLLRTPANPVGILPGEAAAFVMLERPSAASRRGAVVDALLDAPSLTAEPFHRRSGLHAQGRALSQGILETLDAVRDQGARTGLIVGALNGDAYRARDWGHALVQLRMAGRLTDLREWSPAASFGEIGAATGLVGLCMAARGFSRGYARTDHVLVWTAGDDGARGAFYVHAPGSRA
ncbi:hypothetical protein D7V88_17015 [Corallococcus terminator]|uniref:Beta-ketoacyl synthase-like N-terminal domain-containing protein n=1 Tax=Corallococcus terminator TaxID=2316733 RepID=A0A3A8IWE0_9BACT|nr:hypothetical protein D7V88_17015 [Corallococcus terminator]